MATARENKEFAETLLPTYPLDEALEWIKRNLEPEDVFDEKRLISWAEDSGYTKDGDV